MLRFSEPIAARDAPILLRDAAIKAIVAAEPNSRKLGEWLRAQFNSNAPDALLLLGWVGCECKAMCIVSKLGGELAELTLLVVKADVRRKGHGATMVRCAAQVSAKAAGCKRLYADASKAPALFARCGMQAAESGAPSQSVGPWKGSAQMCCMSLGPTQMQPTYVSSPSVAASAGTQPNVPQKGQLIGLWYPPDNKYMLARCDGVMQLLEGESLVNVFYPEDETHGAGQASREKEINGKTAGLLLLSTAQASLCEDKGGMKGKRTWFEVAKVPSQGWLDKINLTAPQELRVRATAQSSTYCLDVLELFAGSAIISKVAKDCFNANTVVVDITRSSALAGASSVGEGQMVVYSACDLSKPDSLRLLNLGAFDVIWAAPVCTTFSPLAFMKHGRTRKRPEGTTPEALKANKMLEVLVTELRRLLELNPTAIIFIEQPGGTYMQYLPTITDIVEKSVDEGGLGLHRVHVTQCAFGSDFKKPHLVWCNCKEAQSATREGQYGCSSITCPMYGCHVRAQGSHASESGSYPERMAWQFLKWAQIDRMRLQPAAASTAAEEGSSSGAGHPCDRWVCAACVRHALGDEGVEAVRHEDDETSVLQDDDMEEPHAAASPSSGSSAATPGVEERPPTSSDEAKTTGLPTRSEGKAKAKASETGSSRTLRARKAGTGDDDDLMELSVETWNQEAAVPTHNKKPRREPQQDDESTIVAMGFSEDVARTALAMNDGNVEKATNMLIDQQHLEDTPNYGSSSSVQETAGGGDGVGLAAATSSGPGSSQLPAQGTLLHGAPHSHGKPYDHEYELGVVMVARDKEEIRVLWWAEDEDEAERVTPGRWCDYMRKAEIIGSINLTDGQVTLTASLNELPWSDRGDKWLTKKNKERAIKSLAMVAARIHLAEREQRQSRDRKPSLKCVEVVAQAP